MKHLLKSLCWMYAGVVVNISVRAAVCSACCKQCKGSCCERCSLLLQATGWRRALGGRLWRTIVPDAWCVVRMYLLGRMTNKRHQNMGKCTLLLRERNLCRVLKAKIRWCQVMRFEYKIIISYYIEYYRIICASCLQCFDAVGWAAGRASSL